MNFKLRDQISNALKASTMKEWIINDVFTEADDESGQAVLSFLNDVLTYGPDKGLIASLVYHDDTRAFYDQFREEINALLVRDGMKPDKLPGWNQGDPLALEPDNIDRLAWFGYMCWVRAIYDVLVSLDLEGA